MGSLDSSPGRRGMLLGPSLGRMEDQGVELLLRTKRLRRSCLETGSSAEALPKSAANLDEMSPAGLSRVLPRI